MKLQHQHPIDSQDLKHIAKQYDPILYMLMLYNFNGTAIRG